MQNTIFYQFIEDFKSAEMIVIGLGAQLHKNVYESEAVLHELLEFYQKHLDKKNYFIITSHKTNLFEGSQFNVKRLANPLMIDENVPEAENSEAKQWDLYNKWLSATLNRRLLIIELGEDFNRPNIFRWPFENINFINQKSKMYRVHDIFPQLPDNIVPRAESISMNALEFLRELKVYIECC